MVLWTKQTHRCFPPLMAKFWIALLFRELLEVQRCKGQPKVPKGGKTGKAKPVNKDRFITKMFLRGDSVILIVRNPRWAVPLKTDYHLIEMKIRTFATDRLRNMFYTILDICWDCFQNARRGWGTDFFGMLLQSRLHMERRTNWALVCNSVTFSRFCKHGEKVWKRTLKPWLRYIFADIVNKLFWN